MLWFIIVLLVIGLVAGFIARALVPGPDPMGIFGTLILGLVGSFIGGLLISLLSGDGLDLRPSGIIGSLVGAVVVTAGWRWWQGRNKPTAADRVLWAWLSSIWNGWESFPSSRRPR